MKRGMFVAVLLVAVAGAVSAGIVLAQLGDTQTASGTVNVTTVSSDLYICEPNGTPGPACGSDDNGDDEAIFETLENLRPGDLIQWDIRLTNIGPEDWTVTNVSLSINETVDPGSDCPSTALTKGNHSSTGEGSREGVFVLGKAGDDLNDNSIGGSGDFLRELNPSAGASRFIGTIRVAVGDYEDLRLRLRLLSSIAVAGCDGNEWNVNWVFDVFE